MECFRHHCLFHSFTCGKFIWLKIILMGELRRRRPTDKLLLGGTVGWDLTLLTTFSATFMPVWIFAGLESRKTAHAGSVSSTKSDGGSTRSGGKRYAVKRRSIDDGKDRDATSQLGQGAAGYGFPPAVSLNALYVPYHPAADVAVGSGASTRSSCLYKYMTS